METSQKPHTSIKLPSLKITGGSTTAGDSTPGTPSQGLPKIRLVSKSQPSTPADSHPPNNAPRPSVAAAENGANTASADATITQTKAGRVSKPSAKKRTREESEDEDDDDVPLANGTSTTHQAKKTKITIRPTTPGLVRQPTLKVKSSGRIPHKPLGEGYDSEAEDREVDPVIEEQFLFRMMPGEHCEYLRTAIQNRQIGVPKSQGGADFQIKWLDEEGRRAVVMVKGQMFAAILLDLPTITEGMKTWDKKSMIKSSDICQMLLVFAPVNSEEEAKTAPLPKAVEHGHRWPHGITPPMHDARNRRFRKRLSKLEIKNKEAEVERLLSADREALNVRTEWIDSNKHNGRADEEDEEEEYEEDAEGEADDYFGDGAAEQQAEEEEEEFEVDDAALEAEFLEAVETPMVDTPGAAAEGVTPGAATAATPGQQGEEEAAAEEEAAEEEAQEEESDEDDEEDGDEDEEEEGDEDEEVAAIRNVIASLKKQLKSYEEQLAASVQPIMRKRLEGNIRNVKSEILLKKSAIGETEED
ncbi:TAFII55 protein conserved region-domain-containing protein [Thermothelomyces heterothallicus CBS 202.75]|uniref:TAFII55 protein conserved region-domain-containing protein n=1 Tax=Thermothelomyces heterothallicus CBS 202.75 TaxID=1149848 RepID=UPI003742A670